MSVTVSIQELLPLHVACVDYIAQDPPGDVHSEIGACFQRVQSWVRKLGHDPYALLNVGIPDVVDGQLSSYGCCVQVPEEVQSGSDGVTIKDLPGGRYAVMNLKKDPQVIGDAIDRFYQAYVPQSDIQLDATRPTYEIYYENRMEYCVPIL